MNVVDIETSNLSNFETEQDFGLGHLETLGLLRIVWADTSALGQSVNTNAELLRIRIVAKVSIPNPEQHIYLTSAALDSRVWSGCTGSKSLNLRIEEVTDARNALGLRQTGMQLIAAPNPFGGQIDMTVLSPRTESSQAMLSVVDVSGRVVYERKVQLENGRNLFLLAESQSWPSGNYQILLQTSDTQHQLSISKF